jgi:hypothetical protein
MTPFEAFLLCTRLDTTYLTVYKWIIRQTSLAPDIICAYPIDRGEFLLELNIIIPVCDIHTANPAI